MVLVPSYEPDTRLLALLDDLRSAEPDAHLVVVDDGSGPAFRDLFLAARRRGATVLTHEVNRGKGCALKTGFRHALDAHPGHEVVCADSDGQHRAGDVLRVAERVLSGDPVVLGARLFSGDVPSRSRFGNSVTRVLFRTATGRDLVDTQTGLRGYAASQLPDLLEVPGERFEWELNALLRAARAGTPITEVEIETVYLEGNASSHFRPLVDSARIYVPLLSFLGSSLLAFSLDLAALLVLSTVIGMLLPAVVGARLLSGTVNFLVNRELVFGAAGTRPRRSAALRYAALASGMLALNYVLVRLLAGAGTGLLTAKVATELLLVLVSYSVQRCLVFRQAQPARAVGVPAPRRPADELTRTGGR